MQIKPIIDAIVEYISDINNYLKLIPLLLVLFIKTRLDLNLGKFWIKWFYWTSLRGLFRIKAHKFSGIYKQRWDIENNPRYEKPEDRQSLITIKQFSNYCYGEFTAKGGKEKYYLFGEVIDRKIIGHWRDIESPLGYFGSFELMLISNKKIKGHWIGHSNERPNDINFHTWNFTAVTKTSRSLFFVIILVKLKRFWHKLFKKKKLERTQSKRQMFGKRILKRTL